MTNEEFGITLRACLEKEQIIQKELAERINRSPQAVSKWANGKSMPDAETFEILDNMLHIRQNYPLIFNGTYEENKMFRPTRLSEINNTEQYQALFTGIMNDFKKLYPSYSDAVLYLLLGMIKYSLGITIFRNSQDEANYFKACRYINDFFSNIEIDPASEQEDYSHFANNWDYVSYTLLYEIIDDQSTKTEDELHSDDFFCGLNGIAQIGLTAATEVKTLIFKNPCATVHAIEDLKDNSVITEFEIALAQLTELYCQYELSFQGKAS